MNEAPTPASQQAGAQPVAGSRRAIEVFCWLIILLTVAGVFASVFASKARPREGERAIRPTPQELIMGRSAVGAAVLSREAGGSATTQPSPPPMTTDRRPVDQLREAADTPAQRLRVAIVAAEVLSAVEALRLIEQAVATADETDDALRRDAGALRELYATGGSPDAIDDDQRASLLERHGWFGRLALTHGLAGTDPERRAALAPARRTIWVGVAVAVGVVGAVLVGVVLLVVGIVLLATAIIGRAPRADAVTPPTILLETFTVYFGTIGLSVAWSSLGLPSGRAAGIAMLIAGNAGALLWPMLRGARWGDFRREAGLTAGRGVLTECLMGVAGYLALLPLAAVGFIITILLARYARADASHPIVEMLTGPPIRLLMVFLLAVVFAPLTEELFFRGALYGHARRRMPWPVAAILVGVIFAAVHPQGWAVVPLLATIGFNMAVLREWRGSLIASVTAHALNNGTALLIGVMLFR